MPRQNGEYTDEELEALRSISHPKEIIGTLRSFSEGKDFRSKKEFDKHLETHNLTLEREAGHGTGGRKVFVKDPSTGKFTKRVR